MVHAAAVRVQRRVLAGWAVLRSPEEEEEIEMFVTVSRGGRGSSDEGGWSSRTDNTDTHS